MHLLEVNMAASCRERHAGLTEMLEEMGNGIVGMVEGGSGGEGEMGGWRRVN